MSVVSSTDVECFRRLSNPEVVDVNSGGSTTRQIAQQMRQAMENVVAAQHQTAVKAAADSRETKETDSSDDESQRQSAHGKAAPQLSRLARAMQAAESKGAPERAEAASAEAGPSVANPAAAAASRASAGAEGTRTAASPSSLPVKAPPAAPGAPAPAAPRAQAVKEQILEDDASSDGGDDDAGGDAKRDPESVRIEKQGYLIELQALQTNKGVKLSRDFSMRDSLTELEFELQKQNSNLNSASAVANMRDMMRLGFNGVEMANAKFGPFLCLDGWASSLTADMRRFDSPLEKLHKRYWRKQQMSPLMELGMIILGSLAMHHFKTKLFGPISPGTGTRAECGSSCAAPSTPAAGLAATAPRLRQGFASSLKSGTPAHVNSGSFGRETRPPPAREASGSRPPSLQAGAPTRPRPVLKPPTAVFGF